MHPRRLPIAVPPAHHETTASYLRRLANVHGLSGDELWEQVTVPRPTPSRRTVDPDRLAALTGRPPRDLAGALLELREPAPNWSMLRHAPQIGCPRCDARHLGGPVFRLFPHHRYVCARHRHWIGPPDINRPGPSLRELPEVVAAQRRHLRLLRRYGWAATYDALLTAFMVCGHLWEHPEDTPLLHLRWETRCHSLIPVGLEATTFSASRIFAAAYPEAVDLATVLASPTWRGLAAGDDADLLRFTTEISRRLGATYRPRDSRDPIAHWIEHDCWRPPSAPPSTFPAAPGHRRPSQLAKVNGQSLARHDRSLLWFQRRRRPGNVLLHHRTVHPAVVREWSTPMERFTGAIWQSQRASRFAD